MKKRFLAIMMVSAMTISCMTGCEGQSATTTTQAQTTAAAVTEAETTEETKAPETTVAEASTEAAETTEGATTEAATEAETTQEETTEAPVTTEAPTTQAQEAPAKASKIEDFAGFYSMSDGSQFIVYKDGSAMLTIYRLCGMIGQMDTIADGKLTCRMAVDADEDAEVYISFNPESMEVEITDSNWEYLTAGDVMEFAEDTEFEKALKAAAGSYKAEDSSELVISEDGSVDLGIFRLCSMEGKITEEDEGAFYMLMEDPSGEDMYLMFDPATGLVSVVLSTWDYIGDEDTFTFSK